MDDWEDWDKIDEKQLPKFMNVSETSIKQIPTTNYESSFLSDSALRATHPYFEAQPTLKILSRNKINSENLNSQNQTINSIPTHKIVTTNQHKSLQEREKEYAEARRRILGINEQEQKSNIKQTEK